MKIGDLRERVTIRTFTTSIDGVGERVTTWSDSVEVWANIKYQNTDSGEKEVGEKLTAHNGVTFTMRARELSETQRIAYRGDEYNIDRISYSDTREFIYVDAALIK